MSNKATNIRFSINSDELDEQIKELLNKRLQRMATSYVENMTTELDREALENRYNEILEKKYKKYDYRKEDLIEQAFEETVDKKVRALFWDDKNSTFTKAVSQHIEKVVQEYIDSLDFSDIINSLIEEYFIRATASKIKEKVAEQVANMLSDKK
jgi:GH35 family endo-1,4-beta-xylanase